ncbi:unnamed protein product, partial [Chrysoparadoxa australica]
MTKRRLWVISELFYPEQTSTGYFLSEIARGLADRWDVKVVCAQPTYSERGIVAPRYEQWHGVEIHRVRCARFDKDRLPLRVMNLLTFTFSSLLFLLQKMRRGDFVLIVTNPPALYPFVGLLARFKGARSSLLVHDVYPNVLAATGHLGRQSALFRLLDRFLSSAARQYDRIVVLGRDMQALIQSKTGMPTSQIVIIPNWGDTELVSPTPRAENSFARRHGMGDCFTVQFSGNIGRTHDVETILTTSQSTSERKDIQYWFIGYGGKQALLRRENSDARSNVFVLPRQPKEDLGEMLASADVLVIAFVPGMKGLSVPSRMYNVMAAGTPIIAMTEPGSELALVVEESDCGWVIPPNDPNALTRLILELATPQG